MKLPKQQQKEIIDGLLPLLEDVLENTERVRKVEGRTLIYEGVTKDQDGKQIEPATEYVYREPIQVPVKHKRRIREVIDKAKTLEGMNEDLARYLVKFGKSKQAITDSIPEHLRTKNS